MEDSPSFSLGLTQLDTNMVAGFVPGVFDYKEPNFVENRSKFRSNPNKMKDIRKAATEKSKKAVEKSSRLSKKDDSGCPRLPKLYPMGGMPRILNVWMYECCSEVDSTIAERVENVIPRIFNWQVVGIKVKYEKFMIEIDADCSDKRPDVDIQSQVDLDIQGFEEFSTVPPIEILKKVGLITDASASHPTKKHKIIVGETNKSTDVYSADDSMDGHYFDWNRSPIQQQPHDVERCSEDNVTASLDAFVEFVDVEGVSADIGPAILECLIAAVKNLKPDNDNVGTSTMLVDYSSTLSKSAQVQLDVILKVIAAPVDDVSIEVVPPSESVVNQHNISNSQLPLDFPDVVVAAHQAAKTPAKIAKRIRTRSKVFKSPYITEYASGSKAIEDRIKVQKQRFTFDGFLISDIMRSGIIEEFKQWMEEGLLKFHAKKKYNDDHYKAKSSLLGVHEINFVVAHRLLDDIGFDIVIIMLILDKEGGYYNDMMIPNKDRGYCDDNTYTQQG
ncbi:hypothetical protein P3S67_005983 [Capsicum chacoense]